MVLLWYKELVGLRGAIQWVSTVSYRVLPGFLQGFIGFHVDCEDADEGFSVPAGSRVVAHRTPTKFHKVLRVSFCSIEES